MLREDIKVIPPGRHGPYTMVFDPVSEVYFKVSPVAAQIMAKLDRDYDLEEFHAKLRRLGIFVTLEELSELIAFLKITHRSGTPQQKGWRCRRSARPCRSAQTPHRQY